MVGAANGNHLRKNSEEHCPEDHCNVEVVVAHYDVEPRYIYADEQKAWK